MLLKIKVPQKTVLLWQIRTALASTVFSVLSFYLCLISLYFLIFAVIYCILLILIIFFFIPYHILSYEIEIYENSLVVRRGFIIKAEYIIPFKRFVYATEYSTPISRRFKLSGLTVRISRSILIIPEIDIRETAKIMSYLGDNDE